MGVYLFQRLTTTLYDAVCDLYCGHPPRESCAGVAIRNVADILQAQLTGIQHATQSLRWLFSTTTVIYENNDIPCQT